MTTIRKIVTSKIDGNGSNANDTGEIRPYGEIAVYVGDNNKLELLMFDGVHTHVRSKVLNKGTFYGGDADSSDGAGYDSIKLVPDETLRQGGSQQYIIVEPTGGEPGHVHIRTGGVPNQSGADLFLGSEYKHVRVSETNNSVKISTEIGEGATHTWTFDTNGILSVPAINNENLFIQGAEIGSTTSGIGITATNGITLTTDALGTPKFWQFGTDGKLSVPAGFIQSTQITGLNLASNYNVHIVADYTDNNHEWIFEASTAELTVPGAIKSKTNTPTGTQVANLPYSLGAGATNGYVGIGVEWNAVVALGDLTGYALTAQQTGSTIFTTTITQMRDDLGGQPAFQTADPLPGYAADITFTLISPDYAPQTINDLELAAGTITWSFGSDGIFTSRNGADQFNVAEKAQIKFGYNGTGDYPHWIATRHNDAAAAGNAIDFYTGDSTQAGVFPTDAILGLTVENGGIEVGTNGIKFSDSTTQTTAWTGIPGPYANDAAAALAGVAVGSPYYQVSGQVFVRLA